MASQADRAREPRSRGGFAVPAMRALAGSAQLVGENPAGRSVPAPVTEIALGGGSPNFLSPESLRWLLDVIDGAFSISPDARRTIERDPRSTTSSQIETLAAAGFRSMSMGVQDFSSAIQDAINRHQTKLQTRWLVDRARAAGFDDSMARSARRCWCSRSKR